MYNVGFGDAFLLQIPDGGGYRRILFDCGSIEAAQGMKIKEVVDRIIRDVTDADGSARIDVVVATHRHKDHVSGFGDPSWDDVIVQEVWMPWTEHPTDAEARRIRDTQSRLALNLQAALSLRGPALGEREQRYQDLVSNSLMLSNDRAMRTLHSGFSGAPRRRFLPADEDGKRSFETDALPGLKVHILGPSRSPEVIRDMDPPKGKSFLRFHEGSPTVTFIPQPPFSNDFRLPVPSSATLRPDDMDKIGGAGLFSDLAVAVALDKAVNGTSLMIILEIAGIYLLFPGDAQWGTWNEALGDPEWRELLGRISFYKIGHHGSHNATPRDFVEKMIPDGISAMASTLTRQIWPDIPRAQLLAGLVARKANVARSDQESSVGKTFTAEEGVIETHIPL